MVQLRRKAKHRAVRNWRGYFMSEWRCFINYMRYFAFKK